MSVFEWSILINPFTYFLIVRHRLMRLNRSGLPQKYIVGECKRNLQREVRVPLYVAVQKKQGNHCLGSRVLRT